MKMHAAGCDIGLENIGPSTVEDRFRDIFAPDHPRRYLRELAYVPSANLPRVVKQAVQERFIHSTKNKTMWEQLERSQMLEEMSATTTNTRLNRYRVHTIQDRGQQVSLIMFDVDLHHHDPDNLKRFHDHTTALMKLNLFWAASPGKTFEIQPPPFEDEELDPAKWHYKRSSRKCAMRFEGDRVCWDHYYQNTKGGRTQYDIGLEHHHGIHAFLACSPIGRVEALELIDDWRLRHGVGVETSLETRGILLPGQDSSCLPCAPGKPHKPVCSTFRQSMALFMEYYEKRSKTPLKVALGQSRQAPERTKPNVVPTSVGKPFAAKSKTVSCKNRMRGDKRFDIPGVSGPITVSKDSSGLLNPKTYYTIADCLAEGDGFNISNAYISRVFREQHGDPDETLEIVDRHRQELRTADSSKNDPRKRRTHIRSFVRYLTRTYNPRKMKQQSEQMHQDRKVLHRHLSIDSRSVGRSLRERVYSQTLLTNRTRFDLYSFLLDIEKWQRRYHGRIATRCSNKGYKVNAGNKVMREFRACKGSRRRCAWLKKLALDLGFLVISDAHSWSKAKCARYELADSILQRAEELQQGGNRLRKRNAGSGRGHSLAHESMARQESKIPPANIRAHQVVRTRNNPLLDVVLGTHDEKTCPDRVNDPWFYEESMLS